MTSRTKIIVASIAIFISTLACSTLLGKNLPETAIPEQPGTETPNIETPVTETPIIEETVSCLVVTNQIVEMNSASLAQDEAETMDFESRDEDNTTYIVTYLVSGNEISDPSFEDVPAELQDDQKDIAVHQKLWGYFAAPDSARRSRKSAEFSIITDGQDNVLASVTQTNDDPTLWALEVDIADIQDYYYLSFTLVHEFAHLLTLGPDQVSPSEAIFNNPDDNDLYVKEVSACPNYFPGEGCANRNSYINQFYNRFWVNIYDEWDDINFEENDDIYYERLDDFYYKYEDQFLTDYSVTHPVEDIAEAFSFFVFSEKPTRNTIAEQKILFFYDYPELIALRANIINNLCASFPH